MRSLSLKKRDVSTTWRGKIPFLYHYYIRLGYDLGKFLDSIQIFCGSERPEDDIVDYLNEAFNIKVESLEDKLELFPKELRFAIERLWTEAHEIRKRKAEYIYDDSIKAILIKHDVENYVGILAIRQKEEVSDLGYKYWWLTLDTVAWLIENKIKEELQLKGFKSPVLTLDFLANNLAFGPSRTKISRQEESRLPLLLDLEVFEFMPTEIVLQAEKVRKENQGLPEYVIRRKVRDACDRVKRLQGCMTKRGQEILSGK